MPPTHTTDQEWLRQQVARFSRWHYEFDLAGVRTPIADPTQANRHEQRKKYFFEPLVELCGGSLVGKRVLDLGCNAGFWSLAAAEAGADYVLGVDGRKMHIDQANLVFQVKGIEPQRYRFELSDVFSLDLAEESQFQVVLCLGLLYHVSRPIELMERISAWNSDLLVIDTALERSARPYFRMRYQDLSDPRSALDRKVALWPSRKAVKKLARTVGYRRVKMLRPTFTNWEGCRSYRRGSRRAFICAKHTVLKELDSEPVELDSEPVAYRAAPVASTRWTWTWVKRAVRARVRRAALILGIRRRGKAQASRDGVA